MSMYAGMFIFSHTHSIHIYTCAHTDTHRADTGKPFIGSNVNIVKIFKDTITDPAITVAPVLSELSALSLA